MVKGICIACLGMKELTEEHIVPKSIGGGFAPKILCRECNSKFGNTIDAKFLSQFQNRLSCIQEEIYGRAKRSRGMFEGEEGEIENTNIKIIGGKDFDVKVISDFEVELARNQIRIKGIFDAIQSSDYIKKSIEQNLPIKVKSKYPDLSADEVKRLTKDVLNQFSDKDVKKESYDAIKYTVKIELDALLLEFGKIAYELACVCHGEDYYLNSDTASVLREDINAGTLSHGKVYALYPKIPFVSDLLEYLAEKKCHVAILWNGFVHMKLFSTTCSVRYEENDKTSNSIAARIFMFGYKGDFKSDNLEDWIKEEIKVSSGFRKLWMDLNRRVSCLMT